MPLGSKDEKLFHQALQMNFCALVFGNAISNMDPLAFLKYDGVLVLESEPENCLIDLAMTSFLFHCA
jgi:hypothetical protein